MIRNIFLSICFGFIGILIIAGVIFKVTQFNAISFLLEDDYRYYSFDNLDYDVEVLENGDSNVVMELTYHYKMGDFSRVSFDLSGDISDLTVSENSNEFTLLNGFDETRPENTFYYEKNGTTTHLELYMQAHKEKRTFTISFIQGNTTGLYSDCADYFHKFLSQTNSMKIGEVSAKIALPKGATKENTLIWGHGAANGKIWFDDDGTVSLSLKNPPKYTYVEARVIMPKELFNSEAYDYGFNNKEKIIRDENYAADKADKERRLSAISVLIGIATAVIIMLIPIIIRVKQRKKNARLQPELEPQYYREINTEISPAVVNKLFFYYKKGTHLPKVVSSTMLDLIHKGIITVHYGGKKSNITLNLEKNKKMKGVDKIIVDFIFKEIGSDNAVEMKQIRKYCKNKKNTLTVKKMLDQLTREMNREFRENEYELQQKQEGKFSFVTVFMLIGAIGTYIYIANNANAPYLSAAMWLLVSFVIAFVVSMNLNKKPARLSQKGENNLALWQGFYNFLNDFTVFEEKDLPELFIWEKYLVCATALGVAEKVLKQLKIKYPQLNDPDYINNNNLMLFNNMYFENGMNMEMVNDIVSVFEGAVSDAQNIISNLSNSSSSGSGGGFSDGGSSGGSGSGGFSGGESD